MHPVRLSYWPPPQFMIRLLLSLQRLLAFITLGSIVLARRFGGSTRPVSLHTLGGKPRTTASPGGSLSVHSGAQKQSSHLLFKVSSHDMEHLRTLAQGASICSGSCSPPFFGFATRSASFSALSTRHLYHHIYHFFLFYIQRLVQTTTF